ncbi:MAG: hypothetical protein HY908_04330 [Myxococcales bacterium]|nr:hypothetical protein [Myxococcales bacterium]
MTGTSFLDRVLGRVSASGVREYTFHHWQEPGKPTAEAVGVLPVPGVDAERFLGRVMDVGHYLGHIDHVVESRVVADPAYAPPEAVRFYQRVKIPLVGDVHQEVAMRRLAPRQGFEIAEFHLLARETEVLSPKVAARSAYADGAWLVAPGLVAYALSSAPRREDVGFVKWKVLTTGADVAAGKVIRGNIEGMARWAAAPG